MGIIMSEPRPVDVSIGNKAIIVVADVITAGLILRLPASIIVSRKDFRFFRPDRIQRIETQSEKFEPHNMTLQEYFDKYH